MRAKTARRSSTRYLCSLWPPSPLSPVILPIAPSASAPSVLTTSSASSPPAATPSIPNASAPGSDPLPSALSAVPPSLSLPRPCRGLERRPRSVEDRHLPSGNRNRQPEKSNFGADLVEEPSVASANVLVRIFVQVRRERRRGGGGVDWNGKLEG